MSRLRLNRALALEQVTNIPDGAGGFTQSWQELGHLWADVSFRSARESLQNGGVFSLATYKITVRGAPVGTAMRPRPDQRFREGQRVFHILSVAEADTEGRYLTCVAREEASV